MCRDNARKCSATRNDRCRLERSNPARSATGRHGASSSSNITSLIIARRSLSARPHIERLSSTFARWKKFRNSRWKPRCAAICEITLSLIHKLDVSKSSLGQLKTAVKTQLEYRLKVGTIGQSRFESHWSSKILSHRCLSGVSLIKRRPSPSTIGLWSNPPSPLISVVLLQCMMSAFGT